MARHQREDPDRSDPAARAAARLARTRSREQQRRILAALALTVIGVVGVLTAEPVTGQAGATVGAVVGALLLLALAVAVWPAPWTKGESTHRELDSIWHELRSDAAQRVAWERYAAWAEAEADTVQLSMLRCAPAHPQLAGAPSPYSRARRQRIDAEDITEATAAMETLRTKAADLELEAERRHHQRQIDAERQQHRSRLDAIERDADAAIQAGEQQARRELAEQEAAERRAQADAVARALRRS
jgi:hypothetical protein